MKNTWAEREFQLFFFMMNDLLFIEENINVDLGELKIASSMS